MVDHKIGRVILHIVSKTEVKPNKVDVETRYLSAIGGKKPGVRYSELMPLIENFSLDGVQIKDATHAVDLEYEMEALRSLLYTDASYNPTDLDQLHGFLGVQDIPTPRDAGTENLRKISMSGKHMPFSKYTRQMKTYPKIIDNDWSFGLAGVGYDYCNNYIPFPVASTGFSASFNRVSEDGNIPALLKNSDGEQIFDCTIANEGKGDVRLRDTINEVLEANWIQIFDCEHVFVEKRVMDNAILQVAENGSDIDLELYNGSWLDVAKLLAFDISDAILVENNPDKVELNDYDLEMLRGAYLARLETEAESTLELKSSHLAKPFRFIKEGMNTAVDAWADFDLGNVPSLPKTQNYMLAFSPERNIIAILALVSDTGTWSANSTYKSMKVASYPASKYFWVGALPFDTSYLFKQGEAMTLGSNTYLLKRTGFYQTSGRIITHSLGLGTYLAALVSTADWNADIGEIYIGSILTNSFTIYNSGRGKDSFSWLIFDNPYELGDSTFNGSGGQTVNHTKGDTNYVPYIIPSADGGGAIGEWWVTDCANTSFIVRNSGAAVTAFKWAIARFDNGGKGSSSFAGSGGVTITHSLGIADYTPLIVPTADPGGQLGAVFVTDITTNSFVVRNTGSAVTAFDWIIPDMKAITGMEIPVLDAQNDNVYYDFTGYTNLPKGTYQLFVYAKDTDQVANDLRIKVRNQTDAVDLLNVTKTLTDSFGYVYAGSFELNADDEGDTIRVTLSKDTVTANTIYVDYAIYEPTINNDDKSPQYAVRRVLVEGNITRELAPRR